MDRNNDRPKNKPKLYYILVIIVSVLAIAASALLMVSAATRTAVANNMAEQKMIIEWEKPVISIIMLAVFFVIGYFVISRTSEYSIGSLFVFTILFHAIAGLALILFGRTAPGGDAAAVFKMAEQMAAGDLSFIGYDDSYLSYYPQQIGLTVFLAFFLKLLSFLPYEFAAHHAIKALYVVFNCITVAFGYLAVKELWRSKVVCATFLYLSIFNIPFIVFSSFIYGEVPSFMAMTIAMYFIFRLEKKTGPAVLNIIFTVLFVTLSVFVRKNSLIFMIAAIIVFLLIFISCKKAEYLITAAAVLVCCLAVLPLTLKYFEQKTGREADSGVTMYSYLAMGMQDTSSRGPGWYNGFNFDTYRDTGMNAKEANRISSEVIKERREYFKNNPSECFKFYREKFQTQWCDPTLASCQATLTDFGGRAQIINDIYNGEYNKYFVALCNMFQNAVYIGVFIWSLLSIKKFLSIRNYRGNLAVFLGIITVIGGLMFHMMWEANSRYIYPYAMLLVPYAAYGFGHLIEKNIFNDFDD